MGANTISKVSWTILNVELKLIEIRGFVYVECKDLGWIRDSGMFPRLNFRFQIGIFIWSVQEAPDDPLSCSRGWRTQFLVDLVRSELLVLFLLDLGLSFETPNPRDIWADPFGRFNPVPRC